MQTFHFAKINMGCIAAGEAHKVPHLLPLLFRQLNAVKHAVMAFLYPMRNVILLPAFQSIVVSSYSINRDLSGGDEQEDVFVHAGPLAYVSLSVYDGSEFTQIAANMSQAL